MYFAKVCQTIEKGNSKRKEATWNKNRLGRDLPGVGFCTTSFGSPVLQKIITMFDLNSSSLSLSLYSLNILSLHLGNICSFSLHLIVPDDKLYTQRYCQLQSSTTYMLFQQCSKEVTYLSSEIFFSVFHQTLTWFSQVSWSGNAKLNVRLIGSRKIPIN